MVKFHYSIYNNEISNLEVAVEGLEKDQSRAFSILEDRLELLTDMKHVYSRTDALQKREFVNMVFDSNLYYENGIYRIPTVLGLLSHNHLKMKRILIYKKEGLLDEDPLSGESGIRTRDTLLRYTHFPGVLLQPLGHLSGSLPSANASAGAQILAGGAAGHKRPDQGRVRGHCWRRGWTGMAQWNIRWKTVA